MAGGLALISTSPAMAQDRSQARSMIISQYGVVAAEQPIGTRAGTAILERGGNAIDAAVAANAAMGLVAPMMNGIGGDLFAIVYEAKSGKIYGLNASGWAPRALSIDFLRGKKIERMPQRGIHSVTVPGAVAGWDALLTRFGTKSLADVLAPAIASSRDGFPVTEIFAAHWSRSAEVVRGDAAAAKVFLPGGRAPKVGDMFRNPDLAASLDEIARGGKDAFYKGDWRAACLRRRPSTAARWRPTTSPSSRPNGSIRSRPNTTAGPSTRCRRASRASPRSMMLNMMETFPIATWGHNSARALHTMIEAKKLAYADMITYVADPRFAKVPVAGCFRKAYARERAALIDPDQRELQRRPPATAALYRATTPPTSTVDRDGNMVSLIQSNYGLFGSGVGVEGGGFVLHNRGALFSLDPKHPNALARASGRCTPSSRP